MILLTTGSELPFNRLVKAVDEWCRAENRSDVYGQIGNIGPDDYTPENFEWSHFLSPADYQKRFDKAEGVIAHAGMGSIISALISAKPILIMPRRLAYRETRNDHQVATTERFAERPGVFAAYDETQVSSVLNTMLSTDQNTTTSAPSKFADENLIGTLRNFIAAR